MLLSSSKQDNFNRQIEFLQSKQISADILVLDTKRYKHINWVNKYEKFVNEICPKCEENYLKTKSLASKPSQDSMSVLRINLDKSIDIMDIKK
ncbi:MAG: hypothetical protein MUE53_08370 [Chitinophagales bacterium]|nr:hypothetical protein [Chitinophagales bacterium]